MGRGRGGGGRYTPNDDRSRSMNSQDVCGQAAAANEARQRGDDENWDGDYDERVPSVEIEREVPDYSHWGIYRDEPRRPETWRDFDPFEDGYDWTNLRLRVETENKEVKGNS